MQLRHQFFRNLNEQMLTNCRIETGHCVCPRNSGVLNCNHVVSATGKPSPGQIRSGSRQMIVGVRTCPGHPRCFHPAGPPAALVACERKLVMIAFGVLKAEKTFDPTLRSTTSIVASRTGWPIEDAITTPADSTKRRGGVPQGRTSEG